MTETGTNSPFAIRDWSDLPRAIVAATQAGSVGCAHLLRALNSGRIALLPLQPECSAAAFKRWMKTTAKRPAIVLIGDDYGADLGPAGWPTAERAVRWCRAVLLHAAGGEVWHYEMAVQNAQSFGRVLVVECTTKTLPAWLNLVDSVRPIPPVSLVIMPPDGLAHPASPARETMQ